MSLVPIHQVRSEGVVGLDRESESRTLDRNAREVGDSSDCATTRLPL